MSSILINELQEEIKLLKNKTNTKINITVSGGYLEITNLIKELNIKDTVINKSENIEEYFINTKFKDFTLKYLLDYVTEVVWFLKYELRFDNILQADKLKNLAAERVFSKLICINWLLLNTCYTIKDINKELNLILNADLINSNIEKYKDDLKFIDMKINIENKLYKNLKNLIN